MNAKLMQIHRHNTKEDVLAYVLSGKFPLGHRYDINKVIKLLHEHGFLILDHGSLTRIDESYVGYVIKPFTIEAFGKTMRTDCSYYVERRHFYKFLRKAWSEAIREQRNEQS